MQQEIRLEPITPFGLFVHLGPGYLESILVRHASCTAATLPLRQNVWSERSSMCLLRSAMSVIRKSRYINAQPVHRTTFFPHPNQTTAKQQKQNHQHIHDHQPLSTPHPPFLRPIQRKHELLNHLRIGSPCSLRFGKPTAKLLPGPLRRHRVPLFRVPS